jgi:hypothetical protein
MKLIGYVRGLTISRGNPYWDSPNLYHCYGEDPEEVGIISDDANKFLVDFLNNKSMSTKEVIAQSEKATYRIIGVSELRIKCCSEKEAVFGKNKERNIPYMRYQFLDQLEELIREIDMIAKFGKVEGKDVYLKFYLR